MLRIGYYEVPPLRLGLELGQGLLDQGLLDQGLLDHGRRLKKGLTLGRGERLEIRLERGLQAVLLLGPELWLELGGILGSGLAPSPRLIVSVFDLAARPRRDHLVSTPSRASGLPPGAS